ncbi:hypothetical protein [Mucilaginibacter dorajii]|uniref:Uncharacterized protein n=2 Tax=Mucilaginibacter dorajii TaxID=692994 RepID=A0ABP7QGC7_9SPHI
MGLIVPVSVLIPISVAVVKYRQVDRVLLLIFYYLLLDGAVDLFAIILADHAVNNLPLLHIYTILEFLLLSFFYIKILKDPLARNIIKFLMVLFPLICIINFTFFQSIFRFNTYTRPLEVLIVMAYSLTYFAQANEANDVKAWSGNSLIWVNIGILLYFSGALFVYSFSNLTTAYTSPKYKLLNLFIWNIHASLLLSMYLLFSWGFYICRKT